MFDMKFTYFNIDCVKLNVYRVLSFRVTCLFSFHCSGVDAMIGGLKGIDHHKRKYYTRLNIYVKALPHWRIHGSWLQ